MREFDGLSALVTGGASGIGLATARWLSERGAHVAVLDRAPEGLPESIIGFTADVADDEAVRTAVESATARLGGLDILVNNAAIGAVGTVEDNDDLEWARVLDVNVTGLVRVTRAALPHLRESAGAAIVNTCSIAAHVGLPQRALYSATKGAVQALTLAMAADHVHEGIRVNCVNPGTADTPWVRRLMSQADDPAAALAALESRQPTGRLVSADEVAAAIAYLAGPHSGSTTGAVLAVDGGMHGLRLPPAVRVAVALTDVAIAKIKDMILAGELRPGDRLPKEADLAERLGLSRSSLREAVKALTLIKVLDVRQGDGTYVTSLSPGLLLDAVAFVVDFHPDASVLQFFEVRRILEPAAAALAATRMSGADLEALRACVDALDGLDDLNAVVANDLEFHRRIAAGAGNDVLCSLIDALSGPTARARTWRGRTQADAIARTRQQHRAILDAIEAREPELARSWATVHVAEIEEWLRRTV